MSREENYYQRAHRCERHTDEETKRRRGRGALTAANREAMVSVRPGNVWDSFFLYSLWPFFLPHILPDTRWMEEPYEVCVFTSYVRNFFFSRFFLHDCKWYVHKTKQRIYWCKFVLVYLTGLCWFVLFCFCKSIYFSFFCFWIPFLASDHLLVDIFFFKAIACRKWYIAQCYESCFQFLKENITYVDKNS